jgi:hypothetical protein
MVKASMVTTTRNQSKREKRAWNDFVNKSKARQTAYRNNIELQSDIEHHTFDTIRNDRYRLMYSFTDTTVIGWTLERGRIQSTVESSNPIPLRHLSQQVTISKRHYDNMGMIQSPT